MKILIILACCYASTSWSMCVPGTEGTCEDAKSIDITEMALFNYRAPSGVEMDQTQYLDMAKESSIDMLVEATKKYKNGKMSKEEYLKVATIVGETAAIVKGQK